MGTFASGGACRATRSTQHSCVLLGCDNCAATSSVKSWAQMGYTKATVHPNTQDDNHMYEETGLAKQGTHGGVPMQKGCMYEVQAASTDTEVTGHSSSLRSHRDERRSSVTAGKQMWELQASQSHLSSWESYGVSPLGMHFSGHMEEKKVTEKSQHGFANTKSFLTNPIAFYNKMSSFNDEGKAGDVIYLKAFNTVSLQATRCLKSQLDDQAQRVNVSWTLLHHEAGNTKFRETVDKLEGRAAVQSDLDGLEEWARTSLLKLSVHMRSPAPGKNNPMQQHRLLDMGEKI
ncbi:hypothetical protein QYF61_026783 [Mycteria americana]|uniref:Uncharacterized protein n=1 Tax=Mycteria americana TaxID=33587 RepID=A0AAN7S4T1_MYCAM|nr:hypothetical protein QYF61_026783 [Mycteria americana]